MIRKEEPHIARADERVNRAKDLFRQGTKDPRTDKLISAEPKLILWIWFFCRDIIDDDSTGLSRRSSGSVNEPEKLLTGEQGLYLRLPKQVIAVSELESDTT